MVNPVDAGGILLFVFYAVSLTKTPFDQLLKVPAWHDWAIRIWAIVLGVVASVVNNRYGLGVHLTTYAAMLNGASGAIAAILTYHVGNGAFVSAFDGKDPDSDTQPAVVTTKGQAQRLVLPSESPPAGTNQAAYVTPTTQSTPTAANVGTGGTKGTDISPPVVSPSLLTKGDDVPTQLTLMPDVTASPSSLPSKPTGTADNPVPL